MPGNVEAAADPNAIVILDVIQKALQRRDAPWPTEKSAVHPDAHHARRLGTFGVQHIKRIFEILKKRVGV